MKRPDYEALDHQGLTYIRPARIISELPHASRASALISATETLSALLGQPSLNNIHFGTATYEAFDMRPTGRAWAKNHDQAPLLLLMGGDLPLDMCPEYEPHAA